MKRIYNDINLSKRNSFGVSESAREVVEFDRAEDIVDYFRGSRPAQSQYLSISFLNIVDDSVIRTKCRLPL